MSKVVEERIPEPAFLRLTAELVLHATNAALSHFDHLQHRGLTKKFNARFAHVTPEAAGAAVNEALKIELLKPVTELLHHATVEGIDRDELFTRASMLGEATATRLFVDRGVH